MIMVIETILNKAIRNPKDNPHNKHPKQHLLLVEKILMLLVSHPRPV